MTSLLSALAHQALHQQDPFDPKDALGTGQVLMALAEEDPAKITSYLLAAKEYGVRLNQVGSLALYQDRPRVGVVLANEFKIFPQDYRTLGDEFGTDALGNYPTLAFAAHLGKDDLQHRALSWGANPHAKWKVNRRMGDYHGKSATISWVGENIRRLNEDMVDTLLARTIAPDHAEQLRRFEALVDAPHRFAKGYLGRFRAMVERFAPGGPHAMTISPWDVPAHDTNLAIQRTAATTHRTDYDEVGKALAVFNPWIEATVPAEGQPHVDCLRACLTTGKEERHFTLPAWCVDRLTVPQAQDLLLDAWHRLLPEWARRLDREGAASWDTAQAWLEGRAKPLKPLDDIATTAPLDHAWPWSARLLLGMVPTAHQLRSLKGKDLSALLEHLPVFPGQDDPDDTLSDVRGLIDQADVLRRARYAAKLDTGPTAEADESRAKAELQALAPRFQSLHERLALEAVAAQAAVAAATERPASLKRKF